MYAEAQNNLGIAYRNLSKLEDRGEQPGAVELGLRGGLRARSGAERKKEAVENEKVKRWGRRKVEWKRRS